MNSAGMWWLMVGSVVVSALVVGQGRLPAGETTEQLRASLEAKGAAAKSYRAKVAMAMEMMGQRVVTTGTCLFKKPNKMRLETVMDMGAMKLEQTQISNGKEVWTYQPKMNMANKIDMAKVGSAIPGAGGPGGGANDISKPFQGLRPDSIALVRTEDLEGKKAYVFAGVPGEPNLPKMPFDLAKVEVWIGADDGLVHRVTMLNTQGKEIMSRTYSNIQVNVEAADSLFEFTPPPGVQVMDMTEATLSMMKTMKGEPKPDKP